MKEDFHIAELIAGYLSDNIDDREKQELESWISESKDNAILFEHLCDTQHYKMNVGAELKYDNSDAWKSVKKKIDRKRFKFNLSSIAKYAAIIIIPLGLLAGLIYQGVYYKREMAFQETELYSSLYVPMNSECNLTLDDGTKVYVNSSTSIKYPTKFKGDTRVVELEGEAYFDVAKSDKPFIVKFKNNEVRVLGTEFNISTYNSKRIQTTLVEGSVMISNLLGETLTLSPSQQAIIDTRSGEMIVKEVNTEVYTSWMHGKINFNDERLEDIMSLLSAWYNMNIVYRDEQAKNIRFSCNVDKYRNVEDFLQLIKMTHKINIELKDSTIILGTIQNIN